MICVMIKHQINYWKDFNIVTFLILFVVYVGVTKYKAEEKNFYNQESFFELRVSTSYAQEAMDDIAGVIRRECMRQTDIEIVEVVVFE